MSCNEALLQDIQASIANCNGAADYASVIAVIDALNPCQCKGTLNDAFATPIADPSGAVTAVFGATGLAGGCPLGIIIHQGNTYVSSDGGATWINLNATGSGSGGGNSCGGLVLVDAQNTQYDAGDLTLLTNSTTPILIDSSFVIPITVSDATNLLDIHWRGRTNSNIDIRVTNGNITYWLYSKSQTPYLDSISRQIGFNVGAGGDDRMLTIDEFLENLATGGWTLEPVIWNPANDMSLRFLINLQSKLFEQCGTAPTGGSSGTSGGSGNQQTVQLPSYFVDKQNNEIFPIGIYIDTDDTPFTVADRPDEIEAWIDWLKDGVTGSDALSDLACYLNVGDGADASDRADMFAHASQNGLRIWLQMRDESNDAGAPAGAKNVDTFQEFGDLPYNYSIDDITNGELTTAETQAIITDINTHTNRPIVASGGVFYNNDYSDYKNIGINTWAVQNYLQGEFSGFLMYSMNQGYKENFVTPQIVSTIDMFDTSTSSEVENRFWLSIIARAQAVFAYTGINADTNIQTTDNGLWLSFRQQAERFRDILEPAYMYGVYYNFLRRVHAVDDTGQAWQYSAGWEYDHDNDGKVSFFYLVASGRDDVTEAIQRWDGSSGSETLKDILPSKYIGGTMHSLFSHGADFVSFNSVDASIDDQVANGVPPLGYELVRIDQP